MCGKACQDNEECRYEKENCEYKCQNPNNAMISLLGFWNITDIPSYPDEPSTGDIYDSYGKLLY